MIKLIFELLIIFILICMLYYDCVKRMWEVWVIIFNMVDKLIYYEIFGVSKESSLKEVKIYMIKILLNELNIIY